jgi:hypothetical protein
MFHMPPALKSSNSQFYLSHRRIAFTVRLQMNFSFEMHGKACMGLNCDTCSCFRRKNIPVHAEHCSCTWCCWNVNICSNITISEILECRILLAPVLRLLSSSCMRLCYKLLLLNNIRGILQKNAKCVRILPEHRAKLEMAFCLL